MRPIVFDQSVLEVARVFRFFLFSFSPPLAMGWLANELEDAVNEVLESDLFSSSMIAPPNSMHGMYGRP